ncbi:MAG: hypothetical protein ACRC6I_04865 [Paracoccaceae bacterium]
MGAGLGGSFHQEGKTMAKGQMRSNKEVKKPKKDKTKPGTAAAANAGTSMSQRFAAAADKGKGEK